MNNISPNQKHLAAQIVVAASEIIAEGGIAAATVRAISEKVGASAPQLYRLFGNMRGLFEHIALVLLIQHVANEQEPEDPVKALYGMIETLISFGLTHHELYLHISTLQGNGKPKIWKTQSDFLREKIQKVATVGRLHVGEEHALEVIHPLCAGMILSSIQRTSNPTNASWLVHQVVHPLLRNDPFEDKTAGKPPALAAALVASITDVDVLTLGEKALMAELLTRVASS